MNEGTIKIEPGMKISYEGSIYLITNELEVYNEDSDVLMYKTKYVGGKIPEAGKTITSISTNTMLHYNKPIKNGLRGGLNLWIVKEIEPKQYIKKYQFQ